MESHPKQHSGACGKIAILQHTSMSPMKSVALNTEHTRGSSRLGMILCFGDCGGIGSSFPLTKTLSQSNPDDGIAHRLALASL